MTSTSQTTPAKENPVTTEYPTIRKTVDMIKEKIKSEFKIIVWYSGSHDSGWFDNFQLQDPAGLPLKNVPPEAERELDDNIREIEKELYEILERRFPGWEIGCDDVEGSNGTFTINSKGTITQQHQVIYCTSDDESPREEIKF